MLSRNLIRQKVGLVQRQAQHKLFHKSAINKLTIPFLSTLPQDPGCVKGSINDNLPRPPVDKSHAGYHWDFEKVLAIGLIPLAGSSLAASGEISTVVDSIFSAILLAHCYVGFESCIVDYIPKRVYGKNHNYAMYMLGMGSLLSAYGIYHLETKENGIVGLTKFLWGTPPKDDDVKQDS